MNTGLNVQSVTAIGSGLEAGIERLKVHGQPTVEAERLLHLLRQSRVTIRRHGDLDGPFVFKAL